MSRYALAKAAGVDSSWLWRFEQGKSGIRMEMRMLLAKGLRISVATLITALEKALANPKKWLGEQSTKG